MANRRCTGCKQDVGSYGIRHRVTDFATSFFGTETPSRRDEKRRAEKIRAHYKVMAARALTIPANPQTVGH